MRQATVLDTNICKRELVVDLVFHAEKLTYFQ